MSDAPPRFRAPGRSRGARALFVVGVVLILVASPCPPCCGQPPSPTRTSAFRDTTVHATGTATLLVDPATLLPLPPPGRPLPLDLQRRVHTVDTVGRTVSSRRTTR